MRALLRFQAVVTWRTISDGRLRSLLAIPLFGVLANIFSGERLLADVAMVPVWFLALGAMVGFFASYDALDLLRWTAPIRGPRVLLAHFFFCGLTSAPAAALLALTLSKNSIDATLNLANGMLLVIAAAAVVPVHQRWRRNGTFESAMGFIGLELVVLSLGAGSAILVVLGRPAIALAPSCAAFAIATTVVVRSVLHEERLPTASGATDPREVAPPRRQPRTPVASQRAGIPNIGLLTVNAVMALLVQFIPPFGTDRFPVPMMLVLGATGSLATASLASCRWLLAGPMERGRMFRRRFGPLLLFAVVCVTIRMCVEEFRPDRTVFFDTFREKGAPRHDGALVLGQVLATEDARDSTNGPAPVGIPGTDLVERPPEVPYMAARVREQLERQFGLDVSEERIASSIRRGWPAQWGPNTNYWVNEQQTAVFDAMDRVHDDFVGEIVSADRRRIVVNACVSVLLCIVMLRGQRVGFTSRWALSGVWVAGCAVIFAPAFAPHSSVAVAVVAAERAVLSFVERISLPVALLVFVALALLLWKSCERAFRRLDITDLPPATNEWGKAQTS